MRSVAKKVESDGRDASVGSDSPVSSRGLLG